MDLPIALPLLSFPGGDRPIDRNTKIKGRNLGNTNLANYFHTLGWDQLMGT